MKKFARALMWGLVLAAPALADIGSAPTYPGGQNGSVEVNKRGSFYGDSSFVYSTSTFKLSVPQVAVTTMVIRGTTYYFPTSQTGGYFLRTDGSGNLTWAAPSAVAISTGNGLGVLDGSSLISPLTSSMTFNSSQFIVSLLGSTSAQIALDPSSVTLLGILTATTPLTLTGSAFGIDTSTFALLGSNNHFATNGNSTSGNTFTSTVTAGGSVTSAVAILSTTSVINIHPVGLTINTYGSPGATGTGKAIVGSAIGATTNTGGEFSASGGTTNIGLTVTSGSTTITAREGLKVNYGATVGSMTFTNLSSTVLAVNANGLVISTTVSGAGAIPPGSTNYINAGSTLQSGATFYVSSGTVADLTLSTVTVSQRIFIGRPISNISNLTMTAPNGNAAKINNIGSSSLSLNLGANNNDQLILKGNNTVQLGAGPFSTGLATDSSGIIVSTPIILSQEVLQSGATFYVSSGTVNGKFCTYNSASLWQFCVDPTQVSPVMTSISAGGTTGGFKLQYGTNSVTAIEYNLGPAGNTHLISNPSIQFFENVGISSGPLYFKQQAAGNNYIKLVASNTVTTTQFVLPAADGSSGQAMITDGAGNLSFTTISGGSGGASTLEVLAGTSRSSPTVTVGFPSPQFQGSVTGSSMTITLANVPASVLPSSVAYLSSTQTFTGQDLWTSASASTFTVLAISSMVIDSQGNRWIYNAANGGSVFLGNNAGTLGTSGNFNAGVGQDALGSVTSAGQMTCIGAESCAALLTGVNSTFIGFNAGTNRVGAASETSVGAESLQANAGGNNVALGNYAARYSQFVDSSVFVGSYAGGTGNAGSTKTVSGVGVGMIGYGATASSTYTLTNAMAIGYNAVVGTSNTIQMGGPNPYAATVAMSTFTASSGTINGQFAINGPGNGSLVFTIAGSTYGVTSASITPTVGQYLVWTSTNYTVGQSTGTGGGGGGAGTITAVVASNGATGGGASGSVTVSVSSVSLSSQVVGNLPVTNLNSGTSADSSHFWRGDGQWISSSSFTGGGGGSGTVGSAAANQIAYYNGATSVTGSNLFQINGTSMTIQSSVSINTSGLSSSNSPVGALDIFLGFNQTGASLLTVGDGNMSNQFIVPDQQPIIAQNGGHLGELYLGGYGGTNTKMIFSNAQDFYSQYINLSNSGEMDFRTAKVSESGIGGSMVFSPSGVAEVVISSLNVTFSTSVTMGSSVTINSNMAVSSASVFNGGVYVSSTIVLGGSSGNSGQFLTSGGVGTVPTWTSAAGGGDAVKAATQTFTGSNTFANFRNSTAATLIVTSSGTGNSLQVNPSGNFGTTDGASGGVLFSDTDQKSQGPVFQIYSDQGVQNALTAPFYLVQNNTAADNPNIYVVANGTSPQNGIRLDGKDYSTIALIDTLRSSASKNGKFQFSSHNNELRGERRNAANNAFESAWLVDSSTGPGIMFIGTDYSRPVSTMDVQGGVTIGLLTAGNTASPTSGLLVQGNSIFQASITVAGASLFKSSITVQGALSVSSSVLLGNDPGTSGQVLTSGGQGAVAAWSTLSGAALASTQTFTGANTFTGSVTFSSGVFVSTKGVTANYTASSTDTFIGANCASNCTITLPTAAGISGKVFRIKMLNTAAAAQVTVGTTSSQTIDGATTQVMTIQYTNMDVISDGSNWNIL